jgi:hypothetical protein
MTAEDGSLLYPVGGTRRGPGDDEAKSASAVTGEPRHWIEYGVLAFVIITAVATVMAAWYTRREWQSLVDNGRHQLRAYVFPDHAELVWGGTAKPTMAEIVIKNSGQTPAYRVSTATVVAVDGYPPRTGPSVPAMPPTRTVVPPAGNYSLSVALPQPLTGDELWAIQKGTQAIYAFGEIAYADAFGEAEYPLQILLFGCRRR